MERETLLALLNRQADAIGLEDRSEPREVFDQPGALEFDGKVNGARFVLRVFLSGEVWGFQNSGSLGLPLQNIPDGVWTVFDFKGG